MPAFNGPNPNLNDAVNRLNRQGTIFDKLIKKLNSFMGGVIAGAGAVSPNADVEAAVQWMIQIANDDRHGYSQSTRWGPSYDCSSFVYEAFRLAGFNLPFHSGYTGTMHTDFGNAGFTWHPGEPSASSLHRGDIMWNNHHTEVYAGDNMLVGAANSRKGIVYRSYYSGWEGFFRYGG